MPIIGNVGRKSLRVRALNISIHIILCIGAVTMIYPMMIMISGSLKSRVDGTVFNVFPRYFTDDNMLFKKYVESRYNEKSGVMNAAYECKFASFRNVNLPIKKNNKAALDWIEFTTLHEKEQTVFDYYVAEMSANGINPREARAFRNLLKEEYHGNLDELNKKYDMSLKSWEEIKVSEGRIALRNFSGEYIGIMKRFKEFKLSLPNWKRAFINLDGEFIDLELRPAYGGDLKVMNKKLGTNYTTWASVTLAKTKPAGGLGEHWASFVKKRLNLHFITVLPAGRDAYVAYLKDKYKKIEMLNKIYLAKYKDFSDIQFPEKTDVLSARITDFAYYIENIVSADNLEITGNSLKYREWLQAKYKTINDLNDAYANGHENFEKIVLSHSAPVNNLQEKSDWFDFVLTKASTASLRLRQSAAQSVFLKYISKRFPSSGEGAFDLQKLNKAYGTKFINEIDVYPSATLPENIVYRKDWLDFIKTSVKPEFIEIEVVGEAGNWQKYLQDKYANIGTLNETWGLTYRSFAEVDLPLHAADAELFKENESSIFKEFLVRNYIMVLDVMLYNGSAIMNTFIYCILAIMTALTVNPLAAYAMSRYKLPTTYKIILICMLTMAFPPMVMGIPNFLVLKKLGLLNTFAALILPAVADGYFIFLLKGFFDSLPQELFEAATLDGANERQIFWNVAMALSKPILAVIALGAFNAAYRNFMMAFIVCQDDKMWTLMVHIYQLIQRASVSVGFAALVISAIPTFLVFVFCQNMIIRGIVVPTEK